jgi:SnoaL-like domain
VRGMQMMADGSLAAFEALYHPDAFNHESKNEPPASRRRGPAAFYSTALWLWQAFADWHWELHHVVAAGDLVVVHATMSGRHVGDFVTYGPRRPAGAGVPTDRAPLRDHADPLVPDGRRDADRALGEPG